MIVFLQLSIYIKKNINHISSINFGEEPWLMFLFVQMLYAMYKKSSEVLFMTEDVVKKYLIHSVYEPSSKRIIIYIYNGSHFVNHILFGLSIEMMLNSISFDIHLKYWIVYPSIFIWNYVTIWFVISYWKFK